MKLFAAIMFLLIAVQPAAAGCCEMHGSDVADHAGMQHDMGGDDASHDCCDTDDGDSPESGDSPGCGSCAQVTPALQDLTLVPVSHTLATLYVRGPDSLPVSAPSNLYRPPRPIS